MTTSLVIQEYLAYKKALGLVYRIDTYRLEAFLRDVGDVDLDAIDPDQIQSFLEGKPKKVTPIWFAKFRTLSGLFKYAISRSYMKRSLLPATLPKRPDRIKPFLYTVEQIRALISVPDVAYHPSSHIGPHTMRTFLLLLYGTGLRPGEALRLTVADVDLDQALLTIRKTKFFKSRLVPIGTDLRQVLAAYRTGTQGNQPSSPESPFLCTRYGRDLKLDSVDNAFEWLRREAGVLRFDGSGWQPRLYDFRHTFAVTRLVTWYRDGKDVQRLLPHLATYLGHVHIDDTAHYLSITNELLKEASSCFERYALREAGHA